MESYIRILYGPYEAHGVIRHKIQKVYGLIKFLTENSIDYNVEPAPHLNRLTIEMNERIIYTCDIRFLKFNITYEDDILCQRIIDVIRTHQELFSTESNIPKFTHIAEGMRWQLIHESSDSELQDTSLSDDQLDAPCNSLDHLFAESGGDEEGEWPYEQHMHHLGKGSTLTALKQFVYNYGCIMQEPFESDESESVMEGASKEASAGAQSQSASSSTASSCICLSLEPPSLYSICYGPPNSEQSQDKLIDKDSQRSAVEIQRPHSSKAVVQPQEDSINIETQVTSILEDLQWQVIKPTPQQRKGSTNTSSILGEGDYDFESSLYQVGEFDAPSQASAKAITDLPIVVDDAVEVIDFDELDAPGALESDFNEDSLYQTPVVPHESKSTQSYLERMSELKAASSEMALRAKLCDVWQKGKCKK